MDSPTDLKITCRLDNRYIEGKHSNLLSLPRHSSKQVCWRIKTIPNILVRALAILVKHRSGIMPTALSFTDDFITIGFCN